MLAAYTCILVALYFRPIVIEQSILSWCVASFSSESQYFGDAQVKNRRRQFFNAYIPLLFYLSFRLAEFIKGNGTQLCAAKIQQSNCTITIDLHYYNRLALLKVIVNKVMDKYWELITLTIIARLKRAGLYRTATVCQIPFRKGVHIKFPMGILHR